LLYGDSWLQENRTAALAGDDWQGLPDDNMVVRLLRDARDASWDIDYESLKLPALVVTGERDCVFRVPADIDRLAARLPNARKINMPEVGHLIPVEAPAELAQLLVDFAAEL